MQFTCLEAKQAKDNGHPMTLLLGFEKDYYFLFIEAPQHSYQHSFTLLVGLVLELDDLLV